VSVETVVSVAAGLGLAAACGFRIFAPMLVVSIAAQAGYLQLGSGFYWIGTTPALIALGVATLVEVLAYYVPWLDNLLDTIATPAAVVAGAVLAASVVTGFDPWLKWTLATIAGGGLAGAVQLTTTGVRGASTVMTGGVGNLAVSSGELVGAVSLSLLSIVFPLVALVAIAIGLLLLARRRARSAPRTS
jgi:hypothetical protein